MANDDGDSADRPGKNGGATRRHGPSIPLAFAGLAALAVGAWGLIGPDVLDSVDMRWVIVALAAAVGLVLVVVPGHKRRSRERASR